jgi:hypothetical protein
VPRLDQTLQLTMMLGREVAGFTFEVIVPIAYTTTLEQITHDGQPT